MPTDDDVREAPESHEPPAGATPTFGLADVSNLMDGFAKKLVGEVESRIRAANRPAPVAEPEPEGITEDEFESLSPVQRNLVDKAIKRAVHGVRKEVGQLRDLGLARIADLTQRSVAEKLPYYKEYQPEIEEQLGRLDPALRTDPQTIELVHDRIAMRHEPERIKQREAEWTRQSRGDAPAPSGNNGRGGGVRADGTAVPTPEEMGFNEDQIGEIDRMGGPDAFARRVTDGRMADWKSYADARTKFKTSRTARGNVITFPKLKVGKGVGGNA